MSEEISPVWREQKSQRLQDIVFAAESSQVPEVKISAGEAKRIELIRKMKNDTDKKEYMIMFNVLMIALSISALCHFIFYGTIFSMLCFISSLVYFFYIRKRLTSATLQLMEYKNNFDKYLWEGFYLKEMRYSAVKLAYLLFFPLLIVFLGDLLIGNDGRVDLWISILVAVVISTIGWLIFFQDDKTNLENIEYELKSLEYLG